MLQVIFDHKKFDCVVDKASLDGLLSCPEGEMDDSVVNIFEGISKVLKRNGKVLIISVINQQKWEKRVFERIGKFGFQHVMTKEGKFISRDKKTYCKLFLYKILLRK